MIFWMAKVVTVVMLVTGRTILWQTFWMAKVVAWWELVMAVVTTAQIVVLFVAQIVFSPLSTPQTETFAPVLGLGQELGEMVVMVGAGVGLIVLRTCVHEEVVKPGQTVKSKSQHKSGDSTAGWGLRA